MWKMSLNMVKLFGQGYAKQKKKIHFGLIAWLMLCSALLNYLQNEFFLIFFSLFTIN